MMENRQLPTKGRALWIRGGSALFLIPSDALSAWTIGLWNANRAIVHGSVGRSLPRFWAAALKGVRQPPDLGKDPGDGSARFRFSHELQKRRVDAS